MTSTIHTLHASDTAEPVIDPAIHTDPAATLAFEKLAAQVTSPAEPPVEVAPAPSSTPPSAHRPSVLMRMFATEPNLAPAQTTPYGLHPKVSLVLLLAAVCVAIIGLLVESNGVHRVTGLFQGVIFGLLFSPQMRIWLPRAPAPLRAELPDTAAEVPADVANPEEAKTP